MAVAVLLRGACVVLVPWVLLQGVLRLLLAPRAGRRRLTRRPARGAPLAISWVHVAPPRVEHCIQPCGLGGHHGHGHGGDPDDDGEDADDGGGGGANGVYTGTSSDRDADDTVSDEVEAGDGDEDEDEDEDDDDDEDDDQEDDNDDVDDDVMGNDIYPLLPATSSSSSGKSNLHSCVSGTPSADPIRARRRVFQPPSSYSSPSRTFLPIHNANTASASLSSRSMRSPLPRTTLRISYWEISVESTLLSVWLQYWALTLDPRARWVRIVRSSVAIASVVTLIWSAVVCTLLARAAVPEMLHLLAEVLLHTRHNDRGGTMPLVAPRAAAQPMIRNHDALGPRAHLSRPPTRRAPAAPSEPDGAAEGGMHLVPLLPGLTIPFSHTLLLLVTLLAAQIVHEVGGHALAAVTVCLSRREARSGARASRSDTNGTVASGTGPRMEADVGSSASPSDPTSCLPRALGCWVPIPAWLVAAFVIFPSSLFGRRQSRRLRPSPSILSLPHKLRILGGGVAANLVSVVLFVLAIGVPSSFAPRPGALVLPYALVEGAHSARTALRLPGGSGGGAAALVRWVWWNDNPLSDVALLESATLAKRVQEEEDTERCAITTPCNDAHGGLRIVKIDPGSALQTAAPVLDTGAVLLSVDDTRFYTSFAQGHDHHKLSSADRLQLYTEALYPSSADQEPTGWCIDPSLWSPNPTSGKSENETPDSSGQSEVLPSEDLFAPTPGGEEDTMTENQDLFGPAPSSSSIHNSKPSMSSNPSELSDSGELRPCASDAAVQGTDVCFYDAQGRRRALNALALVGGQQPLHHFKGQRCRYSETCTTSRSGEARDAGECVFPTIPMVRLTFTSTSVPTGTFTPPSPVLEEGKVPIQTLLLAGSPDGALAGVTVSPYLPRAWTHLLPLPRATFDGWLLMMDLGAGYALLTALSLAVLNALPLPGLDGSTLVWVLLQAVAEKLSTAKGPSRAMDLDPVLLEEARARPRQRRYAAAYAYALAVMGHRTLQALTILGLLSLLLKGFEWR